MYVFVFVSEKFSSSKGVRKLVAARTEKQPLDADFGHKLSFEYLSISILAIASFVSDYIRGSFEEKLKYCVYSWKMQILATSCHLNISLHHSLILQLTMRSFVHR